MLVISVALTRTRRRCYLSTARINKAFRFLEARAAARVEFDKAQAALDEFSLAPQHFDHGARFSVVDRERLEIALPGEGNSKRVDAIALTAFLRDNFDEECDGQ